MARSAPAGRSLFAFFLSLGGGPVRNVVDILYLKAIDMGAVTADVPEFYRLQYHIPDIASRLRYIAKLYNNELHVVAPTSIKSIYDLQGKRIVSSTDVGFYAAKVIFTRLGMNATFDYRTDDGRAVQKIIDGEADAYIGSTGKILNSCEPSKMKIAGCISCRSPTTNGSRTCTSRQLYQVTTIRTS